MTGANPAPPADPRPHDGLAGLDVLVDHARWIIDVHTKRADGIQQRAMGFLGVIGVMLGLVLTGLGVNSAASRTSVRVVACAVVAVLVIAGWAFVRCLGLTTVAVPPVQSAQQRWDDYKNRRITGDVVRTRTAQDFLAADPRGQDPLSSAMADADIRAKRLRVALRWLIASFAAVAILIGTVLLQPKGGDSTHGTRPQRSAPAPARTGTGPAGPVR